MKGNHMKKQPRLFLQCASLVLLPLLSHPAEACSCIPPKSPTQSLKEADAVFLGKVIEIATQRSPEGYGERRIKMEASKSWKGISGKSFYVTTGVYDGDCGYPFVKGKTYLVYANMDKRRKRLDINICSRTRKLEAASGDLKALGAGRAIR
jgi:hypothetical protein